MGTSPWLEEQYKREAMTLEKKEKITLAGNVPAKTCIETSIQKK